MRRKNRFAVLSSRFAVSGLIRDRLAGPRILVAWWGLAVCFAAHAHAPDTSYLRAVVSKHALELRFTFDIATLHRIERLDADRDGMVTRAEAEKAAPEIAAFLRQTITLEVNGTKTELGTLQPLGWPVDAGESVEEKNYGQTLVHFTFKQESKGVIEDFYVLYEVFAQLGAVHRAVANIEQEDKHMEVVFNQFEPDYLYDTFWKPEPQAVSANSGYVLLVQGSAVDAFRIGVAHAWDRVWVLGVVALLLVLGARYAAWRSGAAIAGLLIFVSLQIRLEVGCFLVHPSAYLSGIAAGFLLLMVVLAPLRIIGGRLWGWVFP